MQQKAVYIILFFFMILNSGQADLCIYTGGGTAVPAAYLENYLSSAYLFNLGLEIGTDLNFLFLKLDNQNIFFKEETLSLSFYSLFLNALGKIPWSYSIKPYLLLGAGLTWQVLTKEEPVANYDPGLNIGIGCEYQFVYQQWFFGPFLEIKYHFIYQKSQQEAENNGEYFTLCMGLKMRLFK